MKKILAVVALLLFMVSMLPVSAFAGGGGNPMLGDWAGVENKADSFSVHKDKLTGKFTYVDAAGEQEAIKKDSETLVVGSGAEEKVLSLDSMSGSLTVTSGAGAVEYRKAVKFIDLNAKNMLFLFAVGLIGGLVSGFIGSGGAFVLTPGMMSLGVDGLTAVASNMCHKFPKALVGAYKRYKYGQVDIKLGLAMGGSAVIGVLVGIKIQQYINELWGDAGSNLYVSVAFVVVLVIVGGFVFRDAIKIARTGGVEKTSRLALALQKINLPPMMNLTTANVRISMWFTVPVGFATGLLAATIAVGGFIGVPGMIFVIGASSMVASASELVTAFSMGLVGSVQWGMLGLIDIRLTLIILAGSLFGVQVGALGTTYVKDHMIKFVMGTIMLMVAVSRGLAMPTYLGELGWMDITKETSKMLDNISFVVMCVALLTGAGIIMGAMVKGMKEEKALNAVRAASHGKI